MDVSTDPPLTRIAHYYPPRPAEIAVRIMDFSHLNEVEQRESR